MQAMMRRAVTGTDRPMWLRKKEAGYKSYDLLVEFGLTRAPIDPEVLALSMGIVVHHVHSPGWDGAVKSNERRAEIWVRSDSPRTRRRFTLAHEIGHLMLHPLGEEFRDVAPGTLQHPPEEREANQFAAALLMPRALVQPLMYESRMSVDEMARHFLVSVQAMGIRLDWIRGARDDP